MSPQTTSSKPPLTVAALRDEAGTFAEQESQHGEPALFGVTDGKAVGTYLEHKFRQHLHDRYAFSEGNSARGVDFPELHIDMKVTSVRQPQSSSPFSSGRQKVFGLGHGLLVFVYEKTDDSEHRTGRLNFQHVIFVEARRTADFQMTRGLRQIVENGGNAEDLVAFMKDRLLPVDDIVANQIADEVLRTPPELGYLTISNALQWRLQYARAIEQAGGVDGVIRIR